MGQFKEPEFASILEHDIVLIHKEKAPFAFARIEDISFDKNDHCGQWWKVTLTVLTLPLQKIVWLLDDNHIRFAPFSMSGTEYQFELIPVDKHIEHVPLTKDEPAITKELPEDALGVKKISTRPKVVPLKPEFAKYCPGYINEKET